MGAVVAWDNAARSQLAEIDVTSEVAEMGARSLLTPQIADTWRTGQLSDGNIISVSVDLGEARELRLFALAAPRDGRLPSADAKVRVVASNVSMGASEVLNSGLLSLAMVNGLWVYIAAAAVSARYVQFRLVAGADDPFLQFGLVWVGPALVAARGVSPGQARGYIGSNDRNSVSGVRYATPGAVRRVAQFTIPSMQPADRAGLEAAFMAAGSTGQVFASPFSESPAADGVFGHFNSQSTIRQDRWQRWTAEISVDEDL